jgi:hypothetical protein
MGRTAEADDDFARSLRLKPDMKTSLERRVKLVQSQRSTRHEFAQKAKDDD